MIIFELLVRWVKATSAASTQYYVAESTVRATSAKHYDDNRWTVGISTFHRQVFSSSREPLDVIQTKIYAEKWSILKWFHSSRSCNRIWRIFFFFCFLVLNIQVRVRSIPSGNNSPFLFGSNTRSSLIAILVDTRELIKSVNERFVGNATRHSDNLPWIVYFSAWAVRCHHRRRLFRDESCTTIPPNQSEFSLLNSTNTNFGPWTRRT